MYPQSWFVHMERHDKVSKNKGKIELNYSEALEIFALAKA